jgi:hypothetical protein
VNTIPTADISVRPANNPNFANIIVFLRKTFPGRDDRQAIAWRDSRPPGNHSGRPPIPGRSRTGKPALRRNQASQRHNCAWRS